MEDEFKRYWKLSSPIVAEEMEEIEKTYRPYNRYRSLSVHRRTSGSSSRRYRSASLKSARIGTSETRTIINRSREAKLYGESGLKELLKWIIISIGLVLASPLIIVSLVLILPFILFIVLPCILVYLLFRILSKSI